MNPRRAVAKAVTPAARAYVRHAPGRLGKPTLVRQLLEPSLRGQPRSFVARTRHGFVVAGTSQDMIQRYLYVFGVWEPNLTHWVTTRLGPGRTLVDVGANIGYFSLLGAGLVGPTGRVVALEPAPDIHDQLIANLRRNQVSNVRTLQVAASAERGRIDLFGGGEANSGATTSIASSGLPRVATVEAQPLHELLSAEEVAGLRVIKIDVEGAELDVLRGAAPLFTGAPQDLELVVEVAPSHFTGNGEDPIRLLAGHGFHPYHLPNDYAPVRCLDRVTDLRLQRWDGPVRDQVDLVFSRTDAEVLT